SVITFSEVKYHVAHSFKGRNVLHSWATLDSTASKISVEESMSQILPTQPEEVSESKEQVFNWIAAGIAYGPDLFCGLVIGCIFTSHNQEWFAEKFGRRNLKVTTIAR
ncbi:unnamed protein product, partial [Brassica rapa subsp. narinosa]